MADVITAQEGGGLVTIVIPSSPRHAEQWLYRALVSAYAQTVPCTVKYLIDVDRKYAAWARNRIVDTVTTPFLVFLDADDWLNPRYVEETLQAWEPGSYVYTDMFMQRDGKSVPVPAITCYGFAAKQGEARFHHTTTLFPTEIYRKLGGMDETLFGGEDTDFYLKANAHGVKSIALRRPLMGYTPDGHYSNEAQSSPQWMNTLNTIFARWAQRLNPRLCHQVS
jgi:glycosyltransferase involved in cell wall biosynthesis